MNEPVRQVLILDDEKLLVDVYKEKLENAGYVVHPFYSGYDALAALRAGYAPDVILFDLTMPDNISGYEFIDTIRQESLAPHSIKIALTNAGQEGEIARVKELGAAAHWMKSELLPSEIVSGVTAFLAR